MSGEASNTRRAKWRRGFLVAVAVLACSVLVGSAAAAPASGGRHLPHFTLMNERVAIKKLPFPLRLSFRSSARAGSRLPRAPKHGPVWFGEVERPGATIQAAGTKHWICDFEFPHGELGGGGGVCARLADVLRLDALTIGSCGRSNRWRIQGLAPDGVTGLEVERANGRVTRTIPIVDNTFAFSIGHVDFTLRGVGGEAAEGLERSLPLAGTSGSGPGGCSGYVFTEEKPKN